MTTGYSFVMLERPGGTVFRLEDATATLLREVADRKATRNDVAMWYRSAMESERDGISTVDWPAVNRAILARWSRHALLWIKGRAWSGKCFREARP